MSSSDCPQLVYVDPAGCRRSVTLSGQSLVTLGRRPEADVCLPWDPEISRVHRRAAASERRVDRDRRGAFPERHAGQRLRVEGRRRLRDGDYTTVGYTTLTFCDPREADVDITLSEGSLRPIQTYSEQQQRVLRALCQPLLGDGEGVTPAPDKEVAEALGLASGVVARELEALACSFGFDDLPLAERGCERRSARCAADLCPTPILDTKVGAMIPASTSTVVGHPSLRRPSSARAAAYVEILALPPRTALLAASRA